MLAFIGPGAELRAVCNPDHQRAAGHSAEVNADDKGTFRSTVMFTLLRDYLVALAARRLLKMSKATARSKTKPLIKD